MLKYISNPCIKMQIRGFTYKITLKQCAIAIEFCNDHAQLSDIYYYVPEWAENQSIVYDLNKYRNEFFELLQIKEKE
jgi:hypothetical protein